VMVRVDGCVRGAEVSFRCRCCCDASRSGGCRRDEDVEAFLVVCLIDRAEFSSNPCSSMACISLDPMVWPGVVGISCASMTLGGGK